MTNRLTAILLSAAVFAVGSIAFAATYLDIARFGHVQYTPAPTISAVTNYNTSRNELLTYSYFPVNVTAPGGATLDIDLGDDAAIDAASIGSVWKFQIATGGSAMTVTVGASGFTTVENIVADGTTCEDTGDYIECTASSTSKAVCLLVCND